MVKSKVAVLRTTPETVLDDYQRLCELAGMREALDPSATTILKDNISWHLLYPSANTTPWQLPSIPSERNPVPLILAGCWKVGILGRESMILACTSAFLGRQASA